MLLPVEVPEWLNELFMRIGKNISNNISTQQQNRYSTKFRNEIYIYIARRRDCRRRQSNKKWNLQKQRNKK